MAERFSDRMGITQRRQALQLDAMDEDLRNGLWNWLMTTVAAYHSVGWVAIAPNIWDEFFHMGLDQIPHPTDIVQEIRKWFYSAEWFNVYNFVQYILELDGLNLKYGQFSSQERLLNHYLERELSGYRSVSAKLVPITSKEELDEVRRAVTPTTGFEGVALHITTAVALFGQRPDPDYRNSIKESISAVESAVKLLTGERSGGIDKALAILEKKHGLNSTFKSALGMLYNFTSGKGGIRHAILEQQAITAADARFMLVACSAFANFLIDSNR